MRQIIIGFFLLVTTFLSATEEVITPELLKLLDHFHLQHDGTLESITEVTQQAWLRPKGKERWETPDTYCEIDRRAVLDYYIQTDKLNERSPSKGFYPEVVICGATTSRIETRLRFFEELVQRGIEVEKVILLSGARPLDSTMDQIFDGCRTEGDAFKKMWSDSYLFALKPWKHLQHPMITLDDGSVRRPGAPDIFALLKQSNIKGPVLIITNQPYCCYYEAVARLVLSQSFEFEIVGQGADPQYESTATLLDNLARWIYIHQQINLNIL